MGHALLPYFVALVVLPLLVGGAGVFASQLGRIVQELNNHLNSLQWIDDRATALQQRLHETHYLLQRAYNEHPAMMGRTRLLPQGAWFLNTT